MCKYTNLLPGEVFGAGEGEVGMRGFVHDETCQRDRVLNGGQARYGAASSLGPIHDAGFHLHRPFLSEGRSTARVEKGVGFQFPHLCYTTKIVSKMPFLQYSGNCTLVH